MPVDNLYRIVRDYIQHGRIAVQMDYIQPPVFVERFEYLQIIKAPERTIFFGCHEAVVGMLNSIIDTTDATTSECIKKAQRTFSNGIQPGSQPIRGHTHMLY